ncbi:MAG: hypothetical protein ACLFTH_00430 [Candidatus Woesearchaeota archaeon]
MMKGLGKLFKHMLQSLNPNQYDKISEKLFSQSVSVYFKALLIGLIIMTLLFIPKATKISNSIEEDLDTFSNATMAVDFETSDPVILLNYPEIKVDSNASGRGGSFLTVGKDNLYYRNNILWGNANATFPSTVDLKENREMISKFVNTLAIVLLPGIIIGISLGIFISSVALIMASSLIAYIIKGKKKLSIRDVTVISIHSMLVPIVLTFILIPLSDLYWLSIALYLLIFSLSMTIVKGHKLHSTGLEGEDDESKGAKKGKKKKRKK